jgi:hypothetical protein
LHHALAHVVTQPELFPRNDRLEKRLRANCSAICLEPLRELGPRLLYEGTKPGPAGNASLLLTPLELLDRLAPLMRSPRLHRHGYFGVLARTAAHWKFPKQPLTAGLGRSATATESI